MTHIMTTMLGDLLFKSEGKFFASREGCETRQITLDTAKSICVQNWVAGNLRWLRKMPTTKGFRLFKTAEVKPGDVYITTEAADKIITEYLESL